MPHETVSSAVKRRAYRPVSRNYWHKPVAPASLSGREMGGSSRPPHCTHPTTCRTSRSERCETPIDLSRGYRVGQYNFITRNPIEVFRKWLAACSCRQRLSGLGPSQICTLINLLFETLATRAELLIDLMKRDACKTMIMGPDSTVCLAYKNRSILAMLVHNEF